MSKTVKNSRIYGPIKEQKICVGGGTCSRPDHNFVLTGASPMGES